MNQKVISAVAGAVLVVGVGGMVFSTSSARGTAPAPTPAPAPVAAEQATSSEAVPTTGTATAVPTEVTTPPKPGIAVGEPNPSTPTSTPKPSGITAAEVAEHSSREDCWSTINSTVYNLTSWIPNHPGGERAILQLCGTDGSAKFNGKHGGDSRKVAVLAGFKVGAAAQ